MKRMLSFDLKPGMTVAETVYSIDGRTTLIQAGSALTEKHIRLITSWEIPYIMISEPEEIKAAQPAPEPPPIDLSVLPEVMAKKTLDFTHNFDSAITHLNELFDDARSKSEVDVEAFRDIAAAVVKHLLHPAEAINKVLFRIPVRDELNYPAYHSLAVAALSGMLAQWMDSSYTTIKDIVFAALLHDIGKTKVPRAVLFSKELTAEREEIGKSHVNEGIMLLKDVPYISKEVLAGVIQHHERMDGSGYPVGTKAEKIHPYARIIAVADRLYEIVENSTELNPFLLSETIKREMFAKLDPEVCDTFIRRFNDYLTNNLVQLSDGRKAKVVFLPSLNPTSPILQTDDNQFVDMTKAKEISIVGLTF